MTEVPADPDRECSSCGNRSWRKFTERKPSDYPDDSDVIKHYFVCTECDASGFIYEENGHLQYTAALR